ncbi:MAG: SPOR domain-containing protein [Bacteroidota bacterium]
MKKAILFIALVFSSLYAQKPGPKWVTILDLEDQKVFVDTSTIKEFQNQISVLSITFFKTPQKIEAINGLASSVKSQILFNLGSHKYSTVGTLYYDDKLKILGESSLPGFAGNSELFSVPIDSNQVVANIYAYCLKFINRGDRAVTEKEFSGQTGQARKTLDKLIPKQTAQSVIVPPKKENDTEQKISTKAEKADSSASKALLNPIEKDTTVRVVDNLAKKREEALRTLTYKLTEVRNSSEETNPKGTIFEKRGKYSFQVSSWKSKSKAESEVSKLKAEGHNAFIVEALVSKRRGTWYRVRIGYFNSIDETEAYQKKLK